MALPGETSFVTDETKTVFERWAWRVDKIITHLNRISARLNSDAVNEEGTFTGKGPDANVSGQVSAITGDENYDFEAIVCADDVKFHYLKWNTEGTKIYSIRDFSQNPMGFHESANLVSSVTYSEGTPSTLDLYAYGAPWEVPFDITDASSMTEYMHWEKDANDVITVKGVNEWWQDSAPDAYTGDGWLTGSLDADGAGLFVGYRSYDTDACTEPFDQTDTEAPGWCKGRDVGSDVEFTDEERDAAWETLSGIGIAQTDTLAAVELSTTLECP